MARTRILQAAQGTNTGAFGVTEWSLFVAISLIWGASFLFIAIALDDWAPGLITWMRVGSGAATLALVPRARATIDTEDRGRMMVLSFLWVAIPFTLFPLAQQYINSAVTGMLNGGTPIIATIVAGVLSRKLPGKAQATGLLLGLAGVIFISLAQGNEGDNAWIGIVMVLGATLCYGIAINIAIPLQQKYGSVPVMARMLVLATIWVTPFGISSLARSTFSWTAFGATAIIGVLGTGLAFLIMATLIGKVGAARGSFITYVIPLVALVLGVVFRDDRVVAIALAGSVLIIAGALLASRKES